MEWHLLIIYKMYARHLENTAPRNPIDKTSIKSFLMNVDAWTSRSMQEETPLGVIIILLPIIEKALEANEHISPAELEKIIVGAYIIAWKIMDDLAIRMINFLVVSPHQFYLNYDIAWLADAEKFLIKKLKFELTPSTVEAIVSLIRKYTDTIAFNSLIEVFWNSPLHGCAEYAVEMLRQKSDGLSIVVYTCMLKCARSVSHIKLLLNHLQERSSDDIRATKKHHDKIIITAQERVLALARHNPADKLTFLEILNLSAPGHTTRLEKFQSIMKVSCNKFSDWHTRHIIDTLSQYGFKYPPHYYSDASKQDIFELLRRTFDSCELSRTEKELTVILFNNYSKKISKAFLVDAVNAASIIIAYTIAAHCMSNSNNKPKYQSKLYDFFGIKTSGNHLLSLAETLLNNEYLSNIKDCPKLDDKSFIQFCYETFNSTFKITTAMLAKITEAVKTYDHTLALSIMNCAANTSQLDQLIAIFDAIHWQEKSYHPNSLLQPTPIKQQLLDMSKIIRETIESNREKTLDESSVASPGKPL